MMNTIQTLLLRVGHVHDILKIIVRPMSAELVLFCFKKKMKLNASSTRILPASAAVKANSETKIEKR